MIHGSKTDVYGLACRCIFASLHW